jgi:enoyl-CoA hydratase/carnithine racemase
MVNEVVPAAELRERTQEIALRIASNAPLSVLAAKKTVYLSAEHHLTEAYDLADQIWEPVYLSADAQEGPAAFREKRTPVWKGR